jgi:hypothetical protein
MQILIIGGGNMGSTYAQSFVRSHITSKKNTMILEKSPEKAIELATKDIGNLWQSRRLYSACRFDYFGSKAARHRYPIRQFASFGKAKSSFSFYYGRGKNKNNLQRTKHQ